MSEFLKIHQQGMESVGFWVEEYKETILRTMEQRYRTDVIREWVISDVVINGGKVLIKWIKRFRPLTDEELKENYGR